MYIKYLKVAPETKFVLKLVKKQTLKRTPNFFFPCIDQKPFLPFLGIFKKYIKIFLIFNFFLGDCFFCMREDSANFLKEYSMIHI